MLDHAAGAVDEPKSTDRSLWEVAVLPPEFANMFLNTLLLFSGHSTFKPIRV